MKNIYQRALKQLIAWSRRVFPNDDAWIHGTLIMSAATALYLIPAVLFLTCRFGILCLRELNWRVSAVCGLASLGGNAVLAILTSSIVVYVAVLFAMRSCREEPERCRAASAGLSTLGMSI